MRNESNFPANRFIVYEELVKSNFSFLAEKYRFKISNIERINDRYIEIKYLSEKVFVEFYYGTPGFELDFSIGRIGVEDKSNNKSFTSSDLAFLCGDIQWADYKLYSAHSYNNLCNCLPKLVKLLETCGTSFLEGSTAPYEEMLLDKERRANQWCNEQELKQIKKIAFVAWKKKDYSKIIEIFEPVISILSPLEKKKLEYARKYLRATSD